MISTNKYIHTYHTSKEWDEFVNIDGIATNLNILYEGLILDQLVENMSFQTKINL